MHPGASAARTVHPYQANKERLRRIIMEMRAEPLSYYPSVREDFFKTYQVSLR